MTTTMHPLAEDYLRRLDRASRRLPRSDREELLSQIRSHLDAGLRPGATEADVRNLVAELGPPEDAVAAAGPLWPARRRGAREICALLLLLTGFPPVIGWLVGLGLLLWSPLWTARQKLLGALVWPGGYVVAGGGLLLVPVRVESCPVSPGGRLVECTTSPPSVWTVVAVAVVMIAPLLNCGYLYIAAGRQSEA